MVVFESQVQRKYMLKSESRSTCLHLMSGFLYGDEMMELTDAQREKIDDSVKKFGTLLCAIIDLTDKMPDIDTKIEDGKLIVTFNTEGK